MKRTLVLVAVLAGCTTPVALPDASTSTLAPSAIVPSTAVTTSTLPTEAIDGSPGVGDRMFPELGNGGYDVISYDIALVFDPELSRVESVAGVTATAEVTLASFTLDLVGYTVREVEVDGESASWSRGPRDLRITPEEPIAIGDFTVTIRYDGAPSAVNLTDFPFPTGYQRGNDGSLFAFSQPDGASGMFPVNDHPSDRADVTLSVSVPPPHVVVSGGRAHPVRSENGLSVYRFDLPEVAPYLIPLAIGDFEQVTTNGVVTWMGNGAPLPPGFERQSEVLAALVSDLGPYPFASAGAVVVDSGFPAALETQTLSTYTTASAAWGAPVIAHELAHHWFGNEITLGQWDDIWLNEGFATFMTWRWIERDLGRQAYEAETRRAWDAMAVSNAPPPDDPPGQDLFNATVYQRGGLALVALRDSVGDEAFFEFLRAYVAAFSDETVTTEAFLTFALVVLGPEAERLIVDWVRSEEMPPFPLG
jgi:aminopeptidase N